MTPTPRPSTNTTWYFAEGRVGGGFQEYLTLVNPDSATACSVSLEYLFASDSGSSGASTVIVQVLPSSRMTELVNADLNVAQMQRPALSVATIVTVNVGITPQCHGIVAERPMYFTYHGINSGSDVMGATQLETHFYFADVPTGGSYSSFLSILNPSGGNAATVTATYYANGVQAGSQQTIVQAGTRGTLYPDNAGLPTHVSVLITSTQPVALERPTYFSNLSAGNAGTISGASSVLSTSSEGNDWLFAEGYTGGRFQENLIIANLDVANVPANVTIRLEYQDGTHHDFSVIIQPFYQLIWDVNASGVGASTREVSAEVSSTGAQIIAERELYFQYSHLVNNLRVTADGGTDVVGLPGSTLATTYTFAEGYCNRGYNEWLTLQNPTATSETFNIELINGYGRIYTVSGVQVSALSRFTIDIAALVVQHLVQPGDDHRGYEVSMQVQSSSGVFLAERPEYWNTYLTGAQNPTQGGTDVIGYPGN